MHVIMNTISFCGTHTLIEDCPIIPEFQWYFLGYDLVIFLMSTPELGKQVLRLNVHRVEMSTVHHAIYEKDTLLRTAYHVDLIHQQRL